MGMGRHEWIVGGGGLSVAVSPLPCGVCYCKLIPCDHLSLYQAFIDTLLLPNCQQKLHQFDLGWAESGGNVCSPWVSMRGKGCHLHRKAYSKDTSAC